MFNHQRITENYKYTLGDSAKKSIDKNLIHQNQQSKFAINTNDDEIIDESPSHYFISPADVKLDPLDLAIIQEVYCSGVITAEQIERFLKFRGVISNGIKERLRRLSAFHVLKKLKISSCCDLPSIKKVYILDYNGIDYIRNNIDSNYPAFSFKMPSPANLKSGLVVNQIVLGLLQAKAAIESCEITFTGVLKVKLFDNSTLIYFAVRDNESPHLNALIDQYHALIENDENCQFQLIICGENTSHCRQIAAYLDDRTEEEILYTEDLISLYYPTSIYEINDDQTLTWYSIPKRKPA